MHLTFLFYAYNTCFFFLFKITNYYTEKKIGKSLITISINKDKISQMYDPSFMLKSSDSIKNFHSDDFQIRINTFNI